MGARMSEEFLKPLNDLKRKLKEFINGTIVKENSEIKNFIFILPLI